MHFWSIIAAALTWAVVASAQAAQSSPPTMVMPIPAVPLPVEAIEESVVKNPDGTSTSGVRTTKLYRDAAGRMRIETELSQPFGDPLLMIQLADPVDGFIAILETPAKLAHRLKFPQTGSPTGLALYMGGEGLIDMPGKKTRKSEADPALFVIPSDYHIRDFDPVQ